MEVNRVSSFSVTWLVFKSLVPRIRSQAELYGMFSLGAQTAKSMAVKRQPSTVNILPFLFKFYTVQKYWPIMKRQVLAKGCLYSCLCL